MVEATFPSQALGAQVRGRDVAHRSYGPAFDYLVGFILLVIATPIMLLVALFIYLEDGGPIFFVQSRLGLGGRPFRCFKFRSMNTRAEDQLRRLLIDSCTAQDEWARTHKLRRDPRVTRVGAFIRKYSLDELPQLINVLRADMSLVGPRPIVEAEACRYGRWIHHYYAVRPGLTGLWQVSGRSDTNYRSRVAMDVVYARSKRILLDVRILAATLPAVLIGRGSY